MHHARDSAARQGLDTASRVESGGVSPLADNAYHVVIGADDALLDGFTITAGAAEGDSAQLDDRGGGLLNADSSPAIVNVVFLGNFARSGGGGAIANAGSSAPSLTKVRFIDNLVRGGGGGAMFNTETSAPTIEDAVFFDNKSFNNGSGVEGGFSGDGETGPILDQDPQFESADDARLQAGSPAIDAGLTSVADHPAFPDVDLDGNPRVVPASLGSSGEIDLGPYEFQPDS